jgi:hypothetical protein
MDPRERGKFCQSCNKDVYDISSMTEDEAHEFLRERAGSRVCVNYRYHDDGRIHFRMPARMGLATAALAATALAACTPHDPPKHDPAPETSDLVMGQMPIAQVPDQPPPPLPPLHELKGDVKAVPPPEPTNVRKGDIAVPNEPCDPEPRTKAVLGEMAAPAAVPPKQAIRGDIVLE